MAAISGANIVTDGLIFYIDPSNPNSVSGIGTSIYNLANSSDAGTFVGYTSNPIDNTENESILIDNVSGYVNGPSNIALTNNFTVSVWFKVNVYNTGAIIGKWYAASGNAHRCWIMNTDTPTSSMAIVLSSDGTYTSSTIKRYLVPVNLNEYTHLAFTFASGILLVYKNGTLATVTKSIDGSFSSVYDNATRSIQLGYFFDFQNYYNSANIGIVQIYNRVLSATEILQNYNSFESRYVTTDNIITSGLVYNIDASKNASYPGIGTTIYDLSGSGFAGTLVSSPTFSTLNGGSLVFNGSSYITRSSALNTGQNFSVTAWIYPTALSQRNAIVGNGYPYSTDNGWLFNICNNNFDLYQALMMTIGQDNVLVISNSYVFQLNKWSHIACSVSGGGSSVKFYVNGVETSYGVNNGSGRTLVYTNNEFHIGMRHSTTTERFAGNISQVQIYNTTLTASGIQQNYNATKNRYINVLPPVNDSLILNLDAGNRASYAGTGTTWFDLSGNNLNGTLINGPTYSGTGTSTIITTDGTDDYIEVLDNSLLDFGANNFTVEYWFKKLSTTTGYDNIWGVNKWNVGGGGAGTNEWALEIGQGSTGTGDFVAFAVESGSTTYATSYFNLTNALTQYHQLVGIRSGNKLELYLDGSQLYSNTPAGFTTSVSVNNISGRNLRIANAALNNLYTNTSSAVVRLYSKALSSTEILQNFNFYKSRYGI